MTFLVWLAQLSLSHLLSCMSKEQTVGKPSSQLTSLSSRLALNPMNCLPRWVFLSMNSMFAPAMAHWHKKRFRNDWLSMVVASWALRLGLFTKDSAAKLRSSRGPNDLPSFWTKKLVRSSLTFWNDRVWNFWSITRSLQASIINKTVLFSRFWRMLARRRWRMLPLRQIYCLWVSAESPTQQVSSWTRPKY